MWLAPIAHLLALSTMAPAAETASAAAAQALAEPIATRQTFFAIPFRLDPADHPSRQPAEVQLYVSGDRGATWQLYSKVEPSRRRFMFRAGVDGEFWFLVRTVDRSGQLWPKGPNAPELRVIVDTMPPKLQLQAQRGQAGQITAQWEIDDPHSKPASLIMQYRTTADGPWQEVAIDRRTQPVSGSAQTGQVIWWPHGDAGEIQIRAEVSDLAGNLAVSHAQIKPGADAVAASPQTAATESSGWTAAGAGPAATSWPAQQPTGTLTANDPAYPAQPQAAPAEARGNLPGGQGYLVSNPGQPAPTTGASERPWDSSQQYPNATDPYDPYASNAYSDNPYAADQVAAGGA